jgi:hypothetical protein
MFENKQGGVTLGGGKTKRKNEGGESMKPSARRLFEPIE